LVGELDVGDEGFDGGFAGGGGAGGHDLLEVGADTGVGLGRGWLGGEFGAPGSGKPLTAKTLFTFSQVALYRAVRRLRSNNIDVEVVGIPPS
jgi:hypothetical protein